MIPADNLFQWEPWKSHAAEFGLGEHPQNHLLSDLVIQNYAWKSYIKETVSAGDLPLWNPHLFAGAPFVATGQNAFWYPFSILFLAMPLAKAYGWYTVSQLWLAGALMYVCGRIFGFKRGSAFMSGLIFQGCGFMLVSAAVFPMIIGAAAWLPLLIGGVEMVIRNGTSKVGDGGGKTLPWAALTAFVLGIQILAGHIEITYYSLIVIAFFAAWRLVDIARCKTQDANVEAANLSRGERGGASQGSEENRSNTTSYARGLQAMIKPAAWLLATVLIGLMVGGIQFIPFYEVGASNFREGSASFQEVRSWGFPERRILTFLLPDFFGNPADHSYQNALTGQKIPFTTNFYGEPNPHGASTSNWGIKNYVEGGTYLGILALFLAGIGIISGFTRRGPEGWLQQGGARSAPTFPTWFFTLLSLLSLSFIFGTPLYAVLYYGFPGLNQLHSPFRWVFPLSVSVALLAGYGMEYLAATRFDANTAANNNTTPNMFASDASQPMWKRPLVLWGSPSLITWSAGLAFWGGLAVLIGLYLSRAMYSSLEPLIESVFVGLAQAPDAFPNTAAFYGYLFPQVQHLALILIMCGCVLRTSRCPIYWPQVIGKSPVYIFFVGLVITLDLFAIGRGFNASVDPALLDFKPELVQWLEQQPDRHLWRVTSFDNKGAKPFNANSAWLTGFNDVRGYDSIIAKQYTNYMKLIEPQNELDFNRIQPLGDIEAINSPFVDLLGVKYIITHEELPLPKLKLAHESENLRVYENLGSFDRAYTISIIETYVMSADEEFADAIQQIDLRFRPIISQDEFRKGAEAFGVTFDQNFTMQVPDGATATITTETNRRVFVDAAVSEDSWLILNDSYFPGWRAYIRPIGAPESAETETPVYKVNGNFRGVLLNAGEWTVRFQYSPPSLWIGALTTAMGLVIIGFAAVIWAWRSFYRPEGELSNTASIAKNSVAPMTLNLFNRGIDFLFALFYLRWLGPAGSGGYATAIAIAGIYEILSNFGLNAYLIREVSQARERASEFLLNTTLLRMGTGLIASVPILLYIFTVESNPQTRTAVIFIMVGMVLSGMASGLTGLFYAWAEAEIPAAVQTVTTIMKVGFGVVVLLVGFGFVGLAAVSIIVNAITLIILIFTVRRRYPLNGPWTIDYGLQKQMLIDSYPLMLNHLLATVYWQVDVLILSRMQGEAVVGWYNSSYKYVNALNVIPSFFTFALFPVISRQVKSNIDDARRTFRMAIKLLSLVSLPIAAVVTFLAPVMIGILGGDEFLPHGAIALQVVIWSIPFGWLNSVTNYVLISLGQERIMTRAFVIGVGFNLIGNLIVIPYLSYVGAGLTTIASEIILLGLFNYYLVQKMEPVGWLGLIWKLLAITGAMVAAMWLLSPINLWLAVIVGAAIYPAGLYVLGFFGDEERKILGDILPESIGKRIGLEK